MVNHEYAKVNGIRLHYVTTGSGKLMLFVHGFPEFWHAWKDQLAEFGQEYLTVAPDMRGYNLSSKPTDVGQYQIKILVEDLRQLAEHLGHKKLILVGHDWGGAIAWAFALSHPGYLEKLVVINASHPAIFERELRENPAQQKASEYMLMFQRPEEAEKNLSANNYAFLIEAVLSEGLKQDYFTEEDRKAYLDAWSQPGALTGGLNYYRAAHVGPPAGAGTQTSGNFLPDLSDLTVRVPTLVIWGERDPYLLSGNLRGLERFVPDLTIKRVPDGSHWVVHEKPALVNAHIRDFIAGKH
jgi:pimeloyl-ACP methyl ester carboxylesterase